MSLLLALDCQPTLMSALVGRVRLPQAKQATKALIDLGGNRRCDPAMSMAERGRVGEPNSG